MDPFIGEIRMFGFNFAPRGWALCDGSLLSIAANSALFALLGTQFGGNGVSTFGLPDLRGRFPTHFGNSSLGSKNIGEASGATSVSVLTTNLPSHAHPFAVAATSGLATQVSPAGAVLAAGQGTAEARYATEAADVTLAPMNTSPVGGSQALPIQNPYLVVNFCIAIEGIFPSRP